MDNKLLMLMGLIMIMIAMPLVPAEDSLGTFKQYSCVQLIQTCSTCTFVNITGVTGPNSVILLHQVKMTKTGTFYNYTFCDTDTLGTYRVSGFGNLDGANEIWTYLFTITPSGGAENNTTFFIILIGVAIILLLLGFIFKNYIFTFLAGLAVLAAGVYGMIYGFGNMTNLYTQMVSYIIIGLGAIITIVSGLDLLGNVEGGDTSEDDF